MSLTKKLKSKLLISGITLLSPFAIKAQMTANIDSVVIKANRITSLFRNQNRDIQILDSKQIALLPVKSTTELLSYINGVDIRQRGPWGSQADVNIDGSTFDEVLVLVNGVKMSDPQTGHNMMNLPIPLNSIDHIEVLRGPAAREYGVNALAGAINIITKVPTQNEVAAQVYAGSSFDKDTSNGHTFYGWGAAASATLAGKNQSHILSVAHDEGNGYRYNTAFNAYRLFYQTQIKLNDKNTLQTMAGYVSNDFGANQFYAAPYDNEATENVQTLIAAVQNTIQINKRIKITPRISYKYNKDNYIYIRQKPDVYHNIHETNVITGELQSSITTKKGIIGAGLEYRAEGINSNNLGKRNRNNIGIYAEYKHFFSSRLNASAGVYVNYNSDYDWQAFPSVDVSYRILQDLKLFANAGTGQRLPTFTDLYYSGPSNIGNAQLKPELSSFTEGGLQYSKSTYRIEATAFYRHTTNFIDWVRDNDSVKWQPQNFESVNITGYSVRWNQNLNQLLALSDRYQLGLMLGYTYLNADIKTPSNKTSQYYANGLRHQFLATLNTTILHRIQFNFNARYIYRMSANDYTILDARLSLLFHHWNIYTDLNNLLNTQYKELGAVPMPGRWISLGLRMNMNY